MGGEYFYYLDWLKQDDSIERLDEDLYVRYLYEKSLLKNLFYEEIQNWFRRSPISSINSELIKAMTNDDEEKIKSILRETYNSKLIYDDELYCNRPGMRLAHRIIREMNKEKLNIVDLACGHGELVKQILKDGHNAYATDFSEDRIITLNHSGVKASEGDVQKCDFDSDFFDVVICMECLEHVKDVVLAKNEMHRILKSGGLVIITVPYLSNCESEMHVRQFDDVKISSLFVDTFEIINIIHIPYLNWTYNDNIFFVAKKL